MPAEVRNSATSARLSGGIGGALFLAGAAITAAALLMPHPGNLDEVGYWGL